MPELYVEVVHPAPEVVVAARGPDVIVRPVESPELIRVASQDAIGRHVAQVNPHPQYATDTDLLTGLSSKADLSHPHAIDEVTGLTAALGAKEAAGTAAALLSAHASDTNPHSQYALGTDLISGLAGKADTGHTHPNASSTVTGFLSSTDWNTFNGKEVAGTAAALLLTHTSTTDPHSQYATGTDLTNGLATKAALSHGHALDEIMGLINVLSAQEAAGTAAALMSTHTNAIDPHPQYATDAELANGLALKEAAGTAAALMSAHTSAPNPHSQYATASALASGLAGKSDTSHTHPNASTSTTGFLTATDWNTFSAKEAAGTAVGLLSTHTSATDPHSQYATDTDLVNGLNTKQNTLATATAEITCNDQDLYRYGSKRVIVIDTAFTLSANYNACQIEFTNATGCIVTVPPGLPYNFNCSLLQMGAGVFNLVGGTVNSVTAIVFHRQSHKKSAGQGAACGLTMTGTYNTLLFFGDTAA